MAARRLSPPSWHCFYFHRTPSPKEDSYRFRFGWPTCVPGPGLHPRPAPSRSPLIIGGRVLRCTFGRGSRNTRNVFSVFFFRRCLFSGNDGVCYSPPDAAAAVVDSITRCHDDVYILVIIIIIMVVVFAEHSTRSPRKLVMLFT